MNVYDTKLKFIENLAIVKMGNYKLPVAFLNSKGKTTKSKKHNVHISFDICDGEKPRILKTLSKRYHDTFAKITFDPQQNEFSTSLKFFGKVTEASIVDEPSTDYYTGYNLYGMHLTIETKKFTFPLNLMLILHFDEKNKLVGRNILSAETEEDEFFNLPEVGDIMSGIAQVSGYLIDNTGEKL